ncbi:MAG: hypothetical protein Alpg2KO_06920 [Alphaproteobacteria bacterium]
MMGFIEGMDWTELAGIAAMLILIAERVARLTPTETDNRVLAIIRRIANVLGLNVPDNPGGGTGG